MIKKSPDYVKKIINQLCEANKIAQSEGYGPFSAAVINENGDILVIAHNSVILENSSLAHAEVNAIKKAQEKLGTYDLSKYNLSICITAEPCAMCLGAIMWSGIKAIYYGTPSEIVEKITGFDEGYKPDWQNHFTQKGIISIGNIETEKCNEVLNLYINTGKKVYKPQN